MCNKKALGKPKVWGTLSLIAEVGLLLKLRQSQVENKAVLNSSFSSIFSARA